MMTLLTLEDNRARGVCGTIFSLLGLLSFWACYESSVPFYIKMLGLVGIVTTMVTLWIHLSRAGTKRERNEFTLIYGPVALLSTAGFVFGICMYEPISTKSLSQWTFSPCAYDMAKGVLNRKEPLTRSDLWAMNSACANLEKKALLNAAAEEQLQVLTNNR